MSFISNVQLYMTVVVRSAVTGLFISDSTPKYHVADKHDTIPSHFKLTLGQPALL